jgi:small-conductance mechanosensitive channel
VEAFVRSLWDHTVEARTLYLLGAFVLAALLVRRLPELDRPRLRLARLLLLVHVGALLVVAGLAAARRDPHVLEVIALAGELLCLIALANQIVFRVILPRLGVVIPRILMDILTAVAVVAAMIAVGKRAGFSVAGLITTSAVLTAVIGFSMQDTLGNMMGGLAVQLDNSVRVGDWISLGVGQPQGKVIEIRWRYTAIETRAWETIIIPNAVLMKGQVTIAGRRDGAAPRWRRDLSFFVDYRTPPNEVIHAVLDPLQRDPIERMALDPAPQLLFVGVKDSYAHYQLRYWLDDLSTDDPTDSEARVRIFYALRRADIPMAIPAQAVFVTAESPERALRKQEEEHAQRQSALERVDIFRALPAPRREELARSLVYAPFARGEAVTREGDRDDGLYMIVSGGAVVRLGEREVAQLGPGQFFGEMSLMTGAVRSATVLATTDLLCYRVDKPAFEALLRAHPELADQVAGVLASRRGALEAARDEGGDAARRRIDTEKQDLLGRIRGFFGLFDDRAS